MMGRGRGKVKKQATIVAHEVKEEKIPQYKRRGRPQKQVKSDIKEEKGEKLEGEEANGENMTSNISNKEAKNEPAVENGRKRKRYSQGKGNADSVKEENSTGKETSTDGSLKCVGFRQNGSRRKNKPRRAAEVGVEC
ncbi:uncharacterized protein LOC131322525 [Rhododendron vialii]|uniref:uncharacterized protein LOC131322525 n=1 Tax=Rhododendron vialii TaxID=182163 RepID=UPI00265FE274|nr:uncharacterized protein LOC131322525 [Rhododendron vialii]